MFSLPDVLPTIPNLAVLSLYTALATMLGPLLLVFNRSLGRLVGRLGQNKYFSLGYEVFLALKDGDLDETEIESLVANSRKRRAEA